MHSTNSLLTLLCEIKQRVLRKVDMLTHNAYYQFQNCISNIESCSKELLIECNSCSDINKCIRISFLIIRNFIQRWTSCVGFTRLTMFISLEYFIQLFKFRLIYPDEIIMHKSYSNNHKSYSAFSRRLQYNHFTLYIH